MTSTEISTTAPSHPVSRGRRVWHFTRHYLEMVVAMFAGMVVLGFAERVALPDLALGTELGVLVMATNMAIGMGAWMRVRRHSWRSIAEMSAVMYGPFAVLLLPYWAGVIGAHALMSWGHVAMFPAMALVMLLRPHEYAHH